MNLRHKRLLFPVAAWVVLSMAGAQAQTQDTSGNGLLKGNFVFRHVAVQNVDVNGNPTQVTATYGTITFDGAGNYSITGTQIDNSVSNGAGAAFAVTGSYAIGSNGTGYVSNPLFPTDSYDYDYGAVSQGVFTGSASEAEGENYYLNDIFVAIPVGTAPTNAGFTSAFQTGVLDFAGANSTAIKNALFKLSPDGKGNFASIALSGQASNQGAAALTQTITGGTYNFNTDGSATLTIPLPAGVTSTSALFTGSKTIFESADGNFILGWTATGYDIFFGVKALASSGTNSITKGLYFNAGLEDTPTGFGVDSFYGSINNVGNSAGDGILHARLNFPGFLSYDYGTDDQIEVNGDGTTGVDFNGYQYAFGDSGLAYVGIGTGGTYSLIVGLHAASFSGSGVYLSPIGIVNAASYQPITASLAPGELITLFGTGLSAVSLTTTGGVSFPLTLGGVSVTIDGLKCPIYYVSPTQLSVIVPYEITANTTIWANIQVTNNGAVSNIVQMYFQDNAPGALTQNANGLGYASALHAATGQLVTPANPAQPGEYISLYLTGLGTVTPAIADGALGPTSTLSVADVNTAGNLFVYFNDYTTDSIGNQGTIQFAGLAPGLAGLYQINVQVPPTGLGLGDNVYVELITDSADVNEVQIPYGSVSAGVNARAGSPLARSARVKMMQAHQRKAAERRPRG